MEEKEDGEEEEKGKCGEKKKSVGGLDSLRWWG